MDRFRWMVVLFALALQQVLQVSVLFNDNGLLCIFLILLLSFFAAIVYTHSCLEKKNGLLQVAIILSAFVVVIYLHNAFVQIGEHKQSWSDVPNLGFNVGLCVWFIFESMRLRKSNIALMELNREESKQRPGKTPPA